MSDTLDLNAYFERIGYQGSRVPSLALLRAIMRAQASTIPYEGLDVLLERPINIELAAIFRKLVVERRGGYCLEQNRLLRAVLTELGFRVSTLTARVRIDQPRDAMPPRVHVLLLVMLDGERWITDVAFGQYSLTQPLRLDSAEAQDTLHEPRRIVCEEGRLFHQIKLRDTWNDLYEFTLDEMTLIDQDHIQWFAKQPISPIREQLIVSRIAADGRRLILLNDQFKARATDGQVEATTIATPEELLDVLASHFGLHFPKGTRFGPTGSPWPS